MDKESLNKDDDEYFPVRQCSAVQYNPKGNDSPARQLTNQTNSGVEAVSFKYSCIICSMEAGSTAAKQKAPPVSIQFRGAEHKTRLVFQAAEACLKFVSLCLKTTICYAFRPVPVTSYPYPLTSHHPFARF